MTARARIALAGRMAEVVRAQAFVDSFCRNHGLDEDLARRLDIILEELMVNTIRHGGVEDEPAAVEVAVSLDGDGFRLVYEDRGLPFDPLSVRPPDFDAPADRWPIGRLGVELVRRLLDDARYERAGERNRLTLTKSLAWTKESQS